ncbi:MAG: hypothetical protein ACQBVK_03770 [Candidatus Phytoplasma sp. TWB_XP]
MGGINFSEGYFDEKPEVEKEEEELVPNDLDKLLQENLELKKQLNYKKNKFNFKVC